MKTGLRVVTSTLLASCLATTGLLVAFGQERRSERREQKGTRVETRQRTETRSTEIRRSSLIIGATVTLRAGTQFGTVEEFVINDHGCIDYVIIVYEDKYYPVPWVAATFDFSERAFVLDIEKERIREIPTYKEISELSKADFAQKVDKFYGVETRSREYGRARGKGEDRDDREGDRARSKPRERSGETKPKKSGDEKKPSGDKKSEDEPKSGDKKSDTQKKEKKTDKPTDQ